MVVCWVYILYASMTIFGPLGGARGVPGGYPWNVEKHGSAEVLDF